MTQIMYLFTFHTINFPRQVSELCTLARSVWHRSKLILKFPLSIVLITTLVACGGSSGNDNAITSNSNGDAGISNSDGEASENGTNSNSSNEDPITPTQTTPAPGIVTGQLNSGQTGLLIATGPRLVSESGDQISGIDNIWLSENGWMLMSGFIEFSSSALWRGQYGDMQVILSTGDPISGFPANITFDTTLDATIKDDGTVVALVLLGGAGQGTSAIVEITPGGTVKGRLRPGDTVAEETLLSIDSLIDAGSATFIKASVNLNFGIGVLGELTTDGLVNVFATDFNTGQSPVTPTIDGCEIYFSDNFSGNSFFANQQGDLVFSATQNQMDFVNNTPCANQAVVMYRDGAIQRITTDETLVTGPGNPYSVVNLLGITDDRTVYLLAESFFIDSIDSTTSIWAIDSEGNQNLFTVSNETIPPNFSEKITLSAFDLSTRPRNASFDTASGNYAVVLAKDALRNNRILSGSSRPLPYDDIRTPGASQLNRITGALNDTVPGLSESSFFSSVENVRIISDQSVWFEAIAENTTSRVPTRSGVWRAKPDATPEPMINFADTYTHFGEQISLFDIESYLVSDNGDLLVHGFAGASDNPLDSYEVLIYRRAL